MAARIRYALVAVGCIILAALVFVTLNPQSISQGPHRIVEIGGESVNVAVADNARTRERGLGGRAGLAQDEGMLFVFPADGTYAFWMKDMHFSIDMVWLSATGTVVDIAPDVSPDTYPASFSPRAPARYVLELPAGFTQQYTVRIGDAAGL